MQVIETEIPEVKVLVPRRFEDARGVFCETYSQRALQEIGIHLTFIQDNQSVSTEAGTVRGMHYQIAPFAQDKLVRVISGSVLDVAVDIRRGSPTFGRHVGVILSAENWRQMLIPPGFAHGFCTLEPNTSVVYKVTQFYSPQHERGLLWNDPGMAIPWPVNADAAKLSDKDRKYPKLSEQQDLF